MDVKSSAEPYVRDGLVLVGRVEPVPARALVPHHVALGWLGLGVRVPETGIYRREDDHVRILVQGFLEELRIFGRSAVTRNKK